MMPLHPKIHRALFGCLVLVMGAPPAVADPAPFWAEAGPPQRAYHVLLADAERGRMLAICGEGSAMERRGSVWSIDLSSHVWTEVAVDGTPPDLFDFSAVLDSRRQRVLVLGAEDAAYYPTIELWELSLGTPTWRRLSLTGPSPSSSWGQSVILDESRDQLLVFGGMFSDRGYNSFFNDVYSISLGSTPTWSKLVTQGTPPIGRAHHAAIYDSVLNRMVIFGGLSHTALDPSTAVDVDETWQLSLAGATPRWRFLPPVGLHPSARDGSGIIGIPGNQGLLFGGKRDTSVAADIWTLALDDSTASHWTNVASLDEGPGRRFGIAAAWDPLAQDMILHGGYQRLDALYGRPMVRSDTWALAVDGSARWTRLTPGSDEPQPRSGHGAFYDSSGHRMIVALGYFEGTGGGHSDVWSESVGAAAWSKFRVPPAPFDERYGASMIWDPVGERILLFGGSDYRGTLFNETWEFTPSAGWQQLDTHGELPAPRESHSAIYDPIGQRMIVFGGALGNSYGTVTDEAWTLSLTSGLEWTRLPTQGDPHARLRPTAVFDPVRKGMIVFAGVDSFQTLQGPYELSLDAGLRWTPLSWSAAAPPIPYGMVATYDSRRDRIIALGTRDVYGHLPTTLWALPLTAPTWTEFRPTGEGPMSRDGQSVIYDPEHDRLVLFGGYNGAYNANDTWFVNFDTMTPVLVSLVETSVLPGDVRIVWQTEALETSTVTVERRHGTEPWMSLGDAPIDGRGRVEFEDRDIEPGTSYTYRLRVASGAGEHYFEETTVRTLDAQLSAAVTPQPVLGDMRVRLVLPASLVTRFEVLDVSGRRVTTRDFGTLGAGPHSLSIGRGFKPGLYFVRVSAGSLSTMVRAVVVH